MTDHFSRRITTKDDLLVLGELVRGPEYGDQAWVYGREYVFQVGRWHSLGRRRDYASDTMLYYKHEARRDSVLEELLMLRVENRELKSYTTTPSKKWAVLFDNGSYLAVGDEVAWPAYHGHNCILTFDSIDDADTLIRLLGNSRFKAVEYVVHKKGLV